MMRVYVCVCVWCLEEGLSGTLMHLTIIIIYNNYYILTIIIIDNILYTHISYEGLETQ